MFRQIPQLKKNVLNSTMIIKFYVQTYPETKRKCPKFFDDNQVLSLDESLN